MLIDISYFTSGPRSIQNASMSKNPKPDSQAVNSTIEKYVADLQPGFLRKMVGEDDAVHIEDYLQIADDVSDKDSRYGIICDMLREQFADYVFFHILRYANDQVTATGTVRLKCANEYLSPLSLQVKTWNRMVEGNRRFVDRCMKGECPVDVSVDRNMLEKINAFDL